MEQNFAAERQMTKLTFRYNRETLTSGDANFRCSTDQNAANKETLVNLGCLLCMFALSCSTEC